MQGKTPHHMPPIMQRLTLDDSKIKVISQRMLDPIKATPYIRGKHHIPPIFGFFGAIGVCYLNGLIGLFNLLYNHYLVQ